MNNNYVPRVTQLDALQLDEEVVEIFKNQLLETTKFISPGLLTPFTAELELLIRSIIFKYSVFKDGKTFGQQMLSLKYDDKYLSKRKLYWFFGYLVILKYVKDRLLMSYTSNARAQNFISVLEKFQIIGDFMNMIRFLKTGKKPMLIEYLLNLEMTSTVKISNRYTDFSWTRELLWHSFIELFGVAAPVFNTRYVRRIIKEKLLTVFGKKKTVYSSFVNSNPTLTKNTKCAECRENPILPYYMGCEHVFCHFCLQSNKLDNPKYKCPICDYSGSNLVRVPSG